MYIFEMFFRLAHIDEPGETIPIHLELLLPSLIRVREVVPRVKTVKITLRVLSITDQFLNVYKNQVNPGGITLRYQIGLLKTLSFMYVLLHMIFTL